MAFALMLFGKSDSVVLERAQTRVRDAVAPILDATSRPVETFNDMVAGLQEMANLRAENMILHDRNLRLLDWQAAAYRLEAENAALRRMLNMAPDPGVRFTTARVIGDPGGAYVRTVLVNAGHRDGLDRGQAAVGDAGLVGRVVEVGERSARILLITDMNSRLPVSIGASRHRAILAGDNSDFPVLRYLGPRVEPEAGERVVTSGYGGVLPPGLPIGVVDSVVDGELRVRPYTDWAHLGYLRVVDYELPGILRASGLGGGPGRAR